MGEPVPAQDPAPVMSEQELAASERQSVPSAAAPPPAARPVQPGAAVPPRGTAEPSPGRPGRPGWLVPVLVVLALVVAGMLLVGLLGDDSDDPESASDTATRTGASHQGDEGDGEGDGEPGPGRNLASRLSVEAPEPAPASTDLDGTAIDFESANLVDGLPQTAWRTAGDATGATLTLTLPEPATISRVGLVNGWAKKVPNGTQLVDWYPAHRRVLAVEWAFDDGTVVRQDLAERPGMQRLPVDGITASSIELRILAVSEPGTGIWSRDYTALSEVQVLGTPAG